MRPPAFDPELARLLGLAPDTALEVVGEAALPRAPAREGLDAGAAAAVTTEDVLASHLNPLRLTAEPEVPWREAFAAEDHPGFVVLREPRGRVQTIRRARWADEVRRDLLVIDARSAEERESAVVAFEGLAGGRLALMGAAGQLRLLRVREGVSASPLATQPLEVGALLAEVPAREWLRRRLRRVLAEETPAEGMAIAQGTLARLWDAPLGAGRELLARCQRGEVRLPGARAAEWAESLDAAALLGLETAALERAERLLQAVTAFALAAGSDARAANRLGAKLVEERERLEAIAWALERNEAGEAVRGALEQIDDRVEDHLTAWAAFTAALDDEELLRHVALADPHAWWGRLARDEEA